MPNHVAFLRAINVSGRNITMAALAEHFNALGYQDVQTFITTGNVLFQSAPGPDLGTEIEGPLEALLGFRSEVFVRQASELKAILATAGTLLPRVPTAGEVNVAFLKAPLTEEQSQILATMGSPVDEFLVQGSEVYWICQVAQNASKFSNGVFERKLKLRSTLRRVSVLTQLSDQFFADSPS
jgi:uncharacterized protein (DUF1697 family)